MISNRKSKEAVLIQCLKGLLRREDCFEVVPAEHADWICERLAWHKVLPLAAAMQDPGKKKCRTITRTFQSVTLKNMAREEFYHAQISELFKLFDQTGVDYMPFKGPFWGTQMYEAYQWRHIGDIDILLSRSDARSTADRLIALGYRPDILEGSLDEEFAMRGELALVPGRHQPSGVPVELHWALMPSPRFIRKRYLYSGDFTNETIPGEWRGLHFQLPRPEIQLFYYLLHATCQHQFMRFVHITNMVHFLETFPRLDWERLHNLALERRALAPVHYGLKFVQTFHPLPVEAQHMIRRSKPKPTARILAMSLLPKYIPFSTARQGKTRRNLFRIAMSL